MININQDLCFGLNSLVKMSVWLFVFLTNLHHLIL